MIIYCYILYVPRIYVCLVLLPSRQRPTKPHPVSTYILLSSTLLAAVFLDAGSTKQT
jgi:hypothetical protein